MSDVQPPPPINSFLTLAAHLADSNSQTTPGILNACNLDVCRERLGLETIGALHNFRTKPNSKSLNAIPTLVEGGAAFAFTPFWSLLQIASRLEELLKGGGDKAKKLAAAVFHYLREALNALPIDAWNKKALKAAFTEARLGSLCRAQLDPEHVTFSNTTSVQETDGKLSFIIGRDGQNANLLPDPVYRSVSNVHCTLTYDATNNTLSCQDIGSQGKGSSHGTHLNGEQNDPGIYDDIRNCNYSGLI